tara:strand:- start:874 stop:1305 length:432 start_codon:yes stop_codon:yes gene_type:complete
MATVVETLSNSRNTPVPYRHVLSPAHYSGTFVINDTDDHDFVIDMKGKNVVTLVMDVATSDQTVTVTAYGMHASTATVGDTGVVALDGGSFSTTDGEDIDYLNIVTTASTGGVFPYYLVRCVSAGAATGSPTGTLYINTAQSS